MVLHLHVNMNVYRAVGSHDRAYGFQPQPQLFQVVAAPQRIGVGQRTRRADGVGALGVHQELGVGGEGRVNVYQVNPDA